MPKEHKKEKVEKPYNPNPIPWGSEYNYAGSEVLPKGFDLHNKPILKVTFDAYKGTKLHAYLILDSGEEIRPISIGLKKLFKSEHQYTIGFEIPKHEGFCAATLKTRDGKFCQRLDLDTAAPLPELKLSHFEKLQKFVVKIMPFNN